MPETPKIFQSGHPRKDEGDQVRISGAARDREQGGFETWVIRKLKEQSRDIKQNAATLDEICTLLQLRNNSPTYETPGSPIDGMPNYPLNSTDEFNEHEVSIREKTIFLTMLTKFSKGSWSSVHDATYDVMKNLMSDNLAATFNWAGVNRKAQSSNTSSTQTGKRGFRSTKSSELVYAAVQKMVSGAKTAEIKKFVQDWLKAATGRCSTKEG